MDGAGQEVLTWQTYKTTRAEIQAVSGVETWAANTVEAFTLRKVRIRYTAGVTTEHRVVVCKSGQIYSIRAILNWEERNRELILTTQEYRDQGTY